MTGAEDDAEWTAAQWHGKMLVDRDGKKIGNRGTSTSTSTSRPTNRSSRPSRRASSTGT